MTRDRAKKLLPVIIAWAEGKDIEMVTKDCVGRPLFFKAVRNARFDHSEWRICEPKPEVGMDKTQEEKFEAFVQDQRPLPNQIELKISRAVWQACIEANGIGEEPRMPEGYFKIGENVKERWTGKPDLPFENATVCLVDESGGHIYSTKEREVRRIPAWKPRDGEAVLFRYDGIAYPGVFVDNGKDPAYIAFSYTSVTGACEMIPFNESKRGKTWSEI